MVVAPAGESSGSGKRGPYVVQGHRAFQAEGVAVLCPGDGQLVWPHILGVRATRATPSSTGYGFSGGRSSSGRRMTGSGKRGPYRIGTHHRSVSGETSYLGVMGKGDGGQRQARPLTTWLLVTMCPSLSRTKGSGKHHYAVQARPLPGEGPAG